MTNFYNQGRDAGNVILVRHTSDHSVIAHIKRSADGPGIVLTRISPDVGPLPNVHDIIGPVFSNRRSLRSAVIARMRLANNLRGDEHDRGDKHDK